MKKITEISDLRSHFLQSFLSSKSDTFMHMSFLNFCQLLRYLCLVFYKHVKTGHSKMHRKDLLPAFKKKKSQPIPWETKMSHCTHCVIIMKNTYLTKYNVIDGVIKVALMLFAFFKNIQRIQETG